MNILLSALIGGCVAGLGAALVWLAQRYLGLGEKGQRIGNAVAIVIAIAALRVVPVDQLALRLQSSESVAERADAELFEIPAFKVLHDYYPADYAIMRDTAVQSIKAGETNLQTINRIRPRMLEIFAAQTVKAPDATLGRHLAFVLKQATFLQGQEPRYCHEILNTPGRISFDPSAVFPREMAAEEMTLMADVLRETASRPAAVPAPLDEAVFQPLAERAFARLSPPDVTALTAINFEATRATTAVQMTASCHFALGLLEEINALPLVDKARVFRSLLAEGQSA
jgi:hypothetical protein